MIRWVLILFLFVQGAYSLWSNSRQAESICKRRVLSSWYYCDTQDGQRWSLEIPLASNWMFFHRVQSAYSYYDLGFIDSKGSYQSIMGYIRPYSFIASKKLAWGLVQKLALARKMDQHPEVEILQAQLSSNIILEGISLSQVQLYKISIHSEGMSWELEK